MLIERFERALNDSPSPASPLFLARDQGDPQSQRMSDQPGIFLFGALRVDLVHRRVTNNEREVHLTPIEYRLLATLVKYADKVVTQRQLLGEVWGENPRRQPNSLRVCMAQLRQKLEVNPSQPRYLVTIHGVGYRLAVE